MDGDYSLTGVEKPLNTIFSWSLLVDRETMPGRLSL